MSQVHKRPQAEADLDDIWWHIAQKDPPLRGSDELFGNDNRLARTK